MDKYDMFGDLLLIYCNKSIYDKNIKIEHDSIKCGGASKKIGNYGGIIIRLEIFNHSICFVNACLPRGRKNLD